MSSFFISLLSNQLLSVGTGLSGIVLTNYLLSENSVNKNIDNDYVLIKKTYHLLLNCQLTVNYTNHIT